MRETGRFTRRSDAQETFGPQRRPCSKNALKADEEEAGVALRTKLAVQSSAVLACSVALLGLMSAGSVAGASSSNLIKNGSFEKPVVADPCPGGGTVGQQAPGAFCTYFAASTGVPHWSISGGSIDVVNTSLWMPEKGHQSIDLSGDSSGGVSQNVVTSRKTTYVLRWYGAANPQCGHATKTMDVYWNGTLVGFYNFSTMSVQDMGWTAEHINVIATSTTSNVEFTDATPGDNDCGPTLDHISLTKT
jgi:Protein of unknown function (DUF642)